MIRTIIESPFAGDTKKNTEYARAALLDCLRRGEAPIASHLLHTQVLDDSKAEDRLLGMQAGYAWISVAQQMAVYIDRGISDGMKLAVNLALQDATAPKIRILGAMTIIPTTAPGPSTPTVVVRSLKYNLSVPVNVYSWAAIVEVHDDSGIASVFTALQEWSRR